MDRGRRHGLAVVPLVANILILLSGCDRDVVLGTLSVPQSEADAMTDADENETATTDFPWYASNETGNLDDWYQKRPSHSGGSFASGGAKTTVAADCARTGGNGIRVTIDPGSVGFTFGKLFRSGTMPMKAEYAAWFLVEKTYIADFYWNLFQFRGLTAQGDTLSLWDVNVSTRNGKLEFYVWDQIRQREWRPAVAREMPTGRWFRLAAELTQSANNDGKLIVRVDDSVFVQAEGVSTVVGPTLMWNVGSMSPGLSPSPSTICIDDASIELR